MGLHRGPLVYKTENTLKGVLGRGETQVRACVLLEVTPGDVLPARREVDGGVRRDGRWLCSLEGQPTSLCLCSCCFLCSRSMPGTPPFPARHATPPPTALSPASPRLCGRPPCPSRPAVSTCDTQQSTLGGLGNDPAFRKPAVGGGRGQPGGHRDALAHRSFSYMDSYNRDIRFDNIYISTYFCQIDERRKQLVRGPGPGQGCPAACPLWPHAPGGQRAEGRGPWHPPPAGHFTRANGRCCRSAELRRKRSSSPAPPPCRPRKRETW